MTAPAKLVPLERLLDHFGHCELRLKKAGGFLEAGLYRSVIVDLLRIADEDEAPIDPSEPT